MALFGLILLLALLATLTAGTVVMVPRQSEGRATASDIFKVKGGLLVRNGKQTSCGLGILDNMASLISADCLDYVSGGKAVDSSIKYEAFVDAGNDGATARYRVQNVTVHPGYDPQTKANNVALIQYNKGAKVLWYNYNAVGPSDWTGVVYTQRYLSDIEGMAWATPKVYSQDSVTDSPCAKLSPLYKANPEQFTCGSGVVAPPSASLSACKVPYQVAYASFGGQYVYQTGIFSHFVVEDGKDLCKYGEQRSYYTVISDYLAFAQKELSRTVYYFNPDNVTMPQEDAQYAMAKPSGLAVDAVVVGGDMYAKQPVTTPSQTSSLMSRTTPGGQSPTSKPSGSKDEEEGDSGLSKKSITIVAACSAVGSVLIAVGAFFLVRWWRGHLKRTRDPYKETAAQEILANDLGGATIPGGGHYRSETDVIYGAVPPPAYLASEPSPLISRGPDIAVEMPSPHPSAGDEYPNEKM
ncbi:hypothetical protein GGI20_005171 [Coemansia sp. BCRC 34301]|nr:hypothetical protein GGI20_005171 [Coemansia sp. BCRC 34301]